MGCLDGVGRHISRAEDIVQAEGEVEIMREKTSRRHKCTRDCSICVCSDRSDVRVEGRVLVAEGEDVHAATGCPQHKMCHNWLGRVVSVAFCTGKDTAALCTQTRRLPARGRNRIGCVFPAAPLGFGVRAS